MNEMELQMLKDLIPDFANQNQAKDPLNDKLLNKTNEINNKVQNTDLGDLMSTVAQNDTSLLDREIPERTTIDLDALNKRNLMDQSQIEELVHKEIGVNEELISEVWQQNESVQNTLPGNTPEINTNGIETDINGVETDINGTEISTNGEETDTNNQNTNKETDKPRDEMDELQQKEKERQDFISEYINKRPITNEKLEFGGINLNYTNEEEKILGTFLQTGRLAANNMSKYQMLLGQKNKIRQEEDELLEIKRKITSDKRDLETATRLLKEWYNKYKEDTINDLQESINQMLNGFFNDNHNIRLIQTVSRGNTNVTMEELDAKGNKLGDVNKRLSNAQKQLTGFLVQTTILNTLKSPFLVLDESFSSFGTEEVTKIPLVLENLDNMQFIIIEHKNEMFENVSVKTYELSRDENMKTQIVNVIEVEGDGKNGQ